MAFLLYKREVKHGQVILVFTTEHFQLAGHRRGLIYKAWEKRGKPTNCGWQVPADELIALHTQGNENHRTRRLIIDFHPSAKRRIGLIELLGVHAYTYENERAPGEASWTPMLLQLRDVFYEEYDHITPRKKQAKIARLPEPSSSSKKFIEFLYLKGSDEGWNWGRNGSTNACFLKDDARSYFRKFF